MIEFTQREIGTVLAALRQWQDPTPNNDPYDIATDDGMFEALSEEEIDDLCERINVSDG
jgi:hypothetical protein